jgi:hypothetical protein
MAKPLFWYHHHILGWLLIPNSGFFISRYQLKGLEDPNDSRNVG